MNNKSYVSQEAFLCSIPTIEMLGIQVQLITSTELLRSMGIIIDKGWRSVIANVNVHAFNIAKQNSWFKNFLNESDIVFCDGYGVILGARILGYHIPERITYADWMWKLAEYSAHSNYTIYLLGGNAEVVELAKTKLVNSYPTLKIVGCHHGYFDKRKDSRENEFVINQINQSKPNILVIGFGMPLQERWLIENWEQMDVNIALTGGAVFDYISGTLRRAPAWMTNHGLEWLGRLIYEPHRLWRRYLLGNPIFLWRVVREWININK